jgi:hypothetical protein
VPQLFGSVLVLTQVLVAEQNVGVAVGQVQALATHIWAAGQARLQLPQCMALVVVSTHAPLQIVWLPVHDC